MRLNNLKIHGLDTAPENNIFPNSTLTWQSTKEIDYLRFLINKNMSITDMGVTKMLGELQNQYSKQLDQQAIAAPRKRGRPKKVKDKGSSLTADMDPKDSMLAKLQFAII